MQDFNSIRHLLWDAKKAETTGTIEDFVVSVWVQRFCAQSYRLRFGRNPKPVQLAVKIR